jgi:hypothetical protein
MIVSSVLAAEESGALGIDWGSFALVAIVALVAAVAVVVLFSFGIRLLAIGSPDVAADGSSDGRPAAERPPIATLGAVVCIGLAASAVLYGLYLLIPQFH